MPVRKHTRAPCQQYVAIVTTEPADKVTIVKLEMAMDLGGSQLFLPMQPDELGRKPKASKQYREIECTQLLASVR
jgi:hypothetical protein